ncbi:hypothetical protein ABPG73_020096 [Tetrahymena malaccensis]
MNIKNPQSYKIFDKEQAGKMLEELCLKDQACVQNLKRDLQKIKFIQRKHELQIPNFKQLLQKIEKWNNQQDLILLIQQIVNKSIQLGQNFDFDIRKQFDKVLSFNQDKCFSLSNQIYKRESQDINSKLNENCIQQNKSNFKSNLILNSVKQQQQEKQTTKNKGFQERQSCLEISIQNLKNKSKNNAENNLVNFQEAIENNKENVPFLQSYLQTVLNLLKKVQSGGSLNKEDIKKYLDDLLFDKNKKWTELFLNKSKLFYEFCINLVIIEIYSIIQCREKKVQILSPVALQKVWSLQIDKKDLKTKMLGSIDYESFLQLTLFQKNFIVTKDHPFLQKVVELNQKLNDKKQQKGKVLEEINSYFDEIIDDLRIKSLNIIYSFCQFSRYNPTKQLQLCQILQMNNFLKDENKKVVLIASKILRLYENKENQNQILKACLTLLEQEIETLNQITYINYQTKNCLNIDNLFDLSTRKRIIALLSRETFDQTVKCLCIEVINNYLQYPSAQLTDEELKLQFEIILKYKPSQDVCSEMIKSVLICSQKKQSLPENVIQDLIKVYKRYKDYIQNQIIFIFGFICKNSNIQNIDIFNQKLLEEKVAIFDEDNLVFEERTQENANQPTISEQVAKLFYYSASQGNKLSEDTIFYLLKAMKRTQDVQIKIQCSKAIYMASKYCQFKEDHNDDLFNLIDDNIIDVSTFSSGAFVQQLYHQASQKKKIQSFFIDSFFKIYMFEKSELNDISNLTNEQIIKILSHVATNQKLDKLDESTFQIFEHILNSNSEFMLNEIVNIYFHLTKQKILLPQTSIKALENAFVIDYVQDKVFMIVQNLIQNSQIISEKLLEDISNNLIYSQKSDVREISFNLLDNANDNQEIPNKIFNLVELQRAGKVISGMIKDCKGQAKLFIEKLSNQGQKLPIDTLEALQENLDDQKVLNIIENVAKYGQSISYGIIQKLSESFQPQNQNQHQILNIITNAMSKNYEMPSNFIQNLEFCLQNNLYSQESLSILNLITQKGGKISETTICCLSAFFLKNDQTELRYQALKTIRILIESKNYQQQLFKEAIIGAVVDDDDLIFEISIYIYEFIIVHLDNKQLKRCLKALMDRFLQNKLNNSAYQKVNSILNRCISNLDQEDRQQFQLQNLFQQQKIEQYLEDIEKLQKNQQMLNNGNFFQLSEIINSSTIYQKRVLQFLISLQNKKDVPEYLVDVPEYLVDQIAQLYGNTTDKELQGNCFFFLRSYVVSGKYLSENAIKSIQCQGNFDQIQCLISSKLSQQAISDKFKLLLKIQDFEINNDENSLLNLLLEIQNGIVAGYKFPSQFPQKIISLIKQQNSKNNQNGLEGNMLKICSNILASFLQQNEGFLFDEIISIVIEKYIIGSETQAADILKGYIQIIKNQYSINLDGVLNKLSEQINLQIQEVEIACLQLECFALAIQIHGKLNEKTQNVLEKCFSSDNCTIKFFSFKALRVGQQAGFESKMFLDWCSTTLNLITKQTGVELELFQQFDLLEIISSLKYFNVSILNEKNIKDWKTKLILNNLQKIYDISEQESIDLEQSLQSLKQEECYKEQQNFIQMIFALSKKSELITFEQLKQLIFILPILNFESTLQIIQENKNFISCLQKQYIKYQMIKLMNQEHSSNYYEQQVSEIFKKVDYQIIQKVLLSLSSIQNSKELEDLIKFLAENPQIKVTDIQSYTSSVAQLKQNIEIGLLKNMISFPDDESIFEDLLNKGYTFYQLKQIANQKKSNQKIKMTTIQVFKLIYEYNIPNSQWPFIIQIIQNDSRQLWEKKIHQKAVQINFNPLNRKYCYQIIQELAKSNSQNQHIQDLVNSQFFSSLMQKIRDDQLQTQQTDFGYFFKSLRQFDLIEYNFLSEKPIKKWRNPNIKTWAQQVKNSESDVLTEQFIVEALAVIQQAIYLNNNHMQLSNTQIISCILFLKSGKYQGTLLQVATGEGKSIIICVVAIVLALMKKYVDVITTSQVLAERDAIDKKQLYSLFDISVECNSDNNYRHGIKECYKKDVVYGSIHQFQFDYLRDIYSNYGTLGSRRKERQVIPIIDEVDFILIDECTKFARLTSNFPGMDLLQHFIYYLNKRYQILKESQISVNGVIYFLNYELIYEKLQKIHQNSEIDGVIIKNFIQEYIDQSQKDMEEIATKVSINVETYIRQDLKQYIEELITKKLLLLPKCLEQFYKNQLDKWINSLIVEQFYEENVDFVMQDGSLKPVDFNTGVVQEQTSYSDGLQQIKQVRNNLEVTTENITTNYISNFSYIKTYENNIIGLTGTLGSDNSRQFLRELYNVDLVNVPSSYDKQYIQFEDKLASDFYSWIEEIRNEAKREAIKDRGVLVISENIKISIFIYEELKKVYEPNKIILYNLNKMEQEKNIQEIQEGYVIISTNLSARGTDIKTNDQIEKNGGMHVILTYKPANQRLEDQGLGRTARFGKRGTARLIINKENFQQFGYVNSQKIKNIIYKLEESELSKIKQQITLITHKYKLLSQFCQLQDKLRQSLCKKAFIQELFQKQQPYFLLTLYECCVVSSLEEQWEEFNRKIETRKILDPQLVQNEFEAFKKNIENQINQKQFIQMIKKQYYLIQIANDMIINNTNQISQHDAIFFIDEALKLDSDSCPAAFIGKALLILKNQIDKLDSKNIKNNTIYFLKQSLEGITNEIYILQQKHSDEDCEDDKITQLKKQDMQKIQILTQFANCIQEQVKLIISSQRLIDITSEKEICEQYGIQKEYHSQQINEVASTYEQFNVTFHDLIEYEDLKIYDQAIELISTFKEQVKPGQCNLNINLKNINIQILNSLLSPHLEVQSLNQQQAIDYIQSKKAQYKNQKIDITLNHQQQQIVKQGLSFEEAEFQIRNQEKFPFLNGQTPSVIYITDILVKLCELCLYCFVPLLKQIRKFVKFVNNHAQSILYNLENNLQDKAKQFLDFNKNQLEYYKSIYSQVFDLKFICANKICLQLKEKIFGQSKLQIEFEQLNLEQCLEIIQNIGAKQYDIQIIGQKSEILNSINYNIAQSFLVKEQQQPSLDSENQKFIIKEYSSDNYMNIINKLLGNNVCIQYQGLTQQDVKELIKTKIKDGTNNTIPQSLNLLFILKCIDVKPQNILGQMKDHQFNFSFTSMSYETALKLIPILRKEKIEFSTTIASINKKEMQKMIEKVEIKQEKIKIKEIKPIKELFLNDYALNTILQEYQDRGFQYIFKLIEERFIPIKSIFCIIFLATIQLALVPFLFKFHQTLAISLALEGIIDIYTAYQVYINRQFSWKQYLLNKSINLAIQIKTQGLNSISKAVRYLKNGNQTFLKVLGKTIQQKAIAHAFNQGVSTCQDYALQLIEPKLSSIIQQKVIERFQDPTISYLIAKMLTLDKISKKNKNEQKIKQIIQKIGNSQSNMQIINQIGSEIIQGVLSNPNTLSSKTSILLRLSQTISGVWQVSKVIDNVMSQLLKDLIEYDNHYLKIAKLLNEEIIKKDLQNSLLISEILEQQGIIKTEKVKLNDMIIYKIEFDENAKKTFSKDYFFEDQQIVVEFLSKYSKIIEDQEIKTFNQQIKFLSDFITGQIIGVTKTNLITPWSSYCSGTIQKTITKKLDTNFYQDFDTYEFRMPEFNLQKDCFLITSSREQQQMERKNIHCKKLFTVAFNLLCC